MHLKTLKDIDNLAGKRILLRVAYDVPLAQRNKQWFVADTSRIEATLPTIKYLLQHQCRIVLLSWLGRPEGAIVDKYKMDPVALALSRLLKKPVKKLDNCIGPKVFAAIQAMKPGELIMLENTRFYPEEEKADKRFAKLLVHGLDLIVFDAFAQAHRVHASTTGITSLLPSYAGFLLEKEISTLEKIAQRPAKPMVVVLGGAKLSDKINVLKHLVINADKVLIGGAAANIFFQALKLPIGQSFIEDKFVDRAKRKKVSAVKLAKQIYNSHNRQVLLPVDMIAARDLTQASLIETINLTQNGVIQPQWKFVDIGPKTVKLYVAVIKSAKTIFWNGPMGIFEMDKFSTGTKKIALAIAKNHGTTVIGGGDTETIVKKYNLSGQFTHVSTGGGASLEFLAGRQLPALKHLLKNS